MAALVDGRQNGERLVAVAGGQVKEDVGALGVVLPLFVVRLGEVDVQGRVKFVVPQDLVGKHLGDLVVVRVKVQPDVVRHQAVVLRTVLRVLSCQQGPDVPFIGDRDEYLPHSLALFNCLALSHLLVV